MPAASGPVPVPGHALLALEGERRTTPALAVADLHLGLGIAGAEGLGVAEATARQMAAEIVAVGEERRIRRVIVVGDAKHPIVGAPPPVARIVFDFFSTLLRRRFEVTVVLGNHDVGLARLLPREVSLRSARGWRRGSVGLFHGHAGPDAEVLRAPTLVAGHLHPGFRLAPGSSDEGGKHRCWVRTELAGGSAAAQARRASPQRLVVLPAFNPLAGIESLNRSAPARGRTFLVRRFVAPGRSRAYLLDGTDLGELPTWGVPRSPPRARPGR
jgi:uncharacterized protein